jgi:hypothetical protein
LKIRNIHFEEINHKYTLLNDPSLGFISCTEFVESFFEPFEPKRIANKLVNNIPKYQDRTVDSLIKEWEKAAQDGTAVHKEMEAYINSNIVPNSSKGLQGIEWFKKYDNNSSFDYLTEVIIYNKQLGIAGTIDLLSYNPIRNTYSIIDWKTNKKIDKNSYNGKTGIKPPSYGLMDCKYTLYSLQISLYRYILENNYGLNVEKLFLIHLLEYDYNEYQCDYMLDNIKQMLDYK